MTDFEERLEHAATARYSGVTQLARWERDAFRIGARWAHDEARTVTAEQFDAAAARIRRVYLGDRIRNHTREEARILVAAVLEAAGFTVPEEEQA